ncbi:hypothetical protein HDU67_005685 [Dinochytrium kinnereticum]|nr:hypothetical protein HDU67_005685 [Dinochytrium kinnereticum]
MQISKLRRYGVSKIDNDLLSDNIEVSFHVKDSGELTISDNDVDIDTILLSDVGTGIRSQFDNLEEILAVSDICDSIPNLKMMIATQDAFKFLLFTGSPEMENNLGSKSIDTIDDPSPGIVYDSMPFSRRIELHGCIAQTLELTAETEATYQALLPVMGYHYARSDHIVKKIEILEALGSAQHPRVFDRLRGSKR